MNFFKLKKNEDFFFGKKLKLVRKKEKKKKISTRTTKQRETKEVRGTKEGAHLGVPLSQFSLSLTHKFQTLALSVSTYSFNPLSLSLPKTSLSDPKNPNTTNSRVQFSTPKCTNSELEEENLGFPLLLQQFSKSFDFSGEGFFFFFFFFFV